ncbi:hypothetical protein GOP47_0027017 [Adiantum capillus-veneris]|nr:hypothetical protein GOP47_0026608 [Adiantum capillus-veneris]KAI5058847.1 hypothetical protein GOP47_0027017 [Adiantum capillus-veneris]
MTRVLVQRGQGSSNVRPTSSSSSTAAPPPPPPPPLPPPPSTSLTSNTEEDSKESKELVLADFDEPLNEQIEVYPLAEDEKLLENAVVSYEEVSETLNATRTAFLLEQSEKDPPDCGRQFEAGSCSGHAMKTAECTAVGHGDSQLEAVVLSINACREDQSNAEGFPLPSCKPDGGSVFVSGSSSHVQGMSMNQPSFAATESGLQWSEVTASLPSSTLSSSSVILPSSRRGSWGLSPASSSIKTASGSSRKGWRNVKSSKSPPQTSRASSPRSYIEQDGYNSADEQNPWTVGPRGPEENEERDRQFEVEIRRSRGLEVRRMAEDGNCLFRAVADQVYGDPEMHSETRQMCIDYMEKERDHFSQFVTESFSAYCKRKRRDRAFGNNLEIQAMAEMYNRPIHIFCYGSEPKNIFQGSYETDLPPIRLSYHRNNHYNSLVDPNRSTVGAGLGFGSLSGANVDRDQVKAAIKAQQDVQIDKALLAEGRYYSDLELTEQEMERMVIEESRAEFLAEEYGHQIGSMESSTSAAGTSSDAFNNRLQSGWHGPSVGASPATNIPLTTNMRVLLSMGFSYFRVVEACNIFGDDINDMLCYLLEAETGGLLEDSLHRLKGKAAER